MKEIALAINRSLCGISTGKEHIVGVNEHADPIRDILYRHDSVSKNCEKKGSQICEQTW
jgi:hypothetical protein